jgi:DHA1 family bicyclomycin/chloramphenicol resistance-like MFS transporter
MLGPLYAVYVLKFVDGVTAVSVSWAAFLISTSFFTFIVAKKGDAIKEKEYLLLAGYLVRTISWIFMIFIHNLWMLVLVQICLGLGESLGTPSFNAIFAKHLERNKFIREYSNWSLVANLTSAVGVLIGGAIVNNYSFKVLFILMAIISAVPFLGILLKPRRLL